MPGGPLARIKEEVTSVLPEFGNTSLLFRGLAIPIDTFLEGEVRFGKKVGAYLPYLLPDNHMELDQPATERTDTIVVKHIPSWVTLNVLVEVGGLELRRVSDIDADTNTLMLDAVLESEYPEGSNVTLHSVPIQVSGDIPSSSIDSTIDPNLPRLKNQADGFGPFSVSGDYFEYVGDVVGILRSPGNYASMRELEVTKATVTDTTNKVVEIYVNQTVFNPADVFTDGTVMYLRAYLAYESTVLPVPTTELSSSFGPFLVDWHSGMLRDVTPAKEKFTLTTYPVSSPTALSGPTVVEKNTPLTKLPIHNSSMLTWDLINGSMNRRPGWTSALLDSQGRFAVSTFLVPKFPVPSNWVLNVLPKGNDATLLYQFAPNAQVSVPLTADVNNNVNIDLSSGEEAERFEIAILGTAGAEVLFGDFMIHGAYVERVKYTTVVQIVGRYPYACSGMVIKPMFQTLDKLYMNTQNGQFNAGQILAERTS